MMFCFLISTIRENITALLDRFENQDITYIVEMQSLLDTLKLALTLMREELPAVDSFTVTQKFLYKRLTSEYKKWCSPL